METPSRPLRCHFLCTSFLLVLLFTFASCVTEEEKQATFWVSEGRRTLLHRLKQQKELFGDAKLKSAKNVIFFLCDGCGISTMTASRIYVGEKDRLASPESGLLSFEQFPFISLAKTYTVDKIVGESASTGTAYTSGVKANWNIAGLSGQVQLNDCQGSLDQEKRTTSFIQWAQTAGKTTGFITNTRITHATPSALYAHVPSREWEFSAPQPCHDVATQLIEDSPGKDINLILGGGRRMFLPTSKGGSRNDSRDLISRWIQKKHEVNGRPKLIKDKRDLEQSDIGEYDYVLGLFNSDHLKYEIDRLRDRPETEPSLSQLVRKALTFMKHPRRTKEGYFLFVEGGKVDLSHHKNWAAKALEEAYQFNKAVQVAVDETSPEDTLIVVTADHSHGLTINGYAQRGTPILGIAGHGTDHLTYTTMMYASGPGHVPSEQRVNQTTQETSAPNFSHFAGIPMRGNDIAVHTGEDVPVYARGPGAHLLTGLYDQTYIAHAISYAACIGHHKDLCSNAFSAASSLTLAICSTLLSVLYEKHFH